MEKNLIYAYSFIPIQTNQDNHSPNLRENTQTLYGFSGAHRSHKKSTQRKYLEKNAYEKRDAMRGIPFLVGVCYVMQRLRVNSP
jgi:DNA-dependent RNA polymerase auxiliary subunit epsilon